MKCKIKEVINQLLIKTRIKVIFNTIYLIKNYHNLGYFKSVFYNKPINKEGKPIPWFTYPAIEYLNSLDLKEKKVLEFGSGYSTIFFAKRAKKVISIEHDRMWFKKIQKKLKKYKNSEIIYARKDEYGKIKLKEKFDIVIVDGIKREDVVKNCLKTYLKENGILILDNSDWYPKIKKYLKNKNLEEIQFIGMGPINHYNWTTSFYFCSNNRL